MGFAALDHAGKRIVVAFEGEGGRWNCQRHTDARAYGARCIIVRAKEAGCEKERSTFNQLVVASRNMRRVWSQGDIPGQYSRCGPIFASSSHGCLITSIVLMSIGSKDIKQWVDDLEFTKSKTDFPGADPAVEVRVFRIFI